MAMLVASSGSGAAGFPAPLRWALYLLTGVLVGLLVGFLVGLARPRAWPRPPSAG